jgi:glutathione S-transferase
MKLYYSPGTCSMAAHLALREAGLVFELEKIDLMGERKTASGEDYTTVNPKGYVPALELDSGEVLTECGAVLQYIAAQKPEAGLAPAIGSLEYYRMIEWIQFIATELHKNFAPLFYPEISEDGKQTAREMIGKRLDYVNAYLADKDYLLGDNFTAPDCYMAAALGWAQHVQLDLSPWQNITTYVERLMSRPQMQATLKAEGLI